jgi:hypothetical protein
MQPVHFRGEGLAGADRVIVLGVHEADGDSGGGYGLEQPGAKLRRCVPPGGSAREIHRCPQAAVALSE